MQYVYPFTNENVTSFKGLYNFNNARVLSVLGSGDQYFSSLLYGAKEVELYDISSMAWDYFILKYYGIMILSYEEFYDYFVIKELNDLKYFKRLILYLPSDVADRLSKVYKLNKGLSNNLYSNVTDIMEDGTNIPYFKSDNYYKLQSILLNEKLPIFYLTDFVKLSNKVFDKNYDVILTSNIFDWLYKDCEVESVGIYKSLLEKFNYLEIQALYSWNNLDSNLEMEFLKHGFSIDMVPSSRRLSLTDKNRVVSLRKY